MIQYRVQNTQLPDPTGLNISPSSTTRENSVLPSDFPTKILNTFLTSSTFARQPVSSVRLDYNNPNNVT
jgi:hypothetical protein